jgi:ribose transport system substrate-binding protein
MKKTRQISIVQIMLLALCIALFTTGCAPEATVAEVEEVTDESSEFPYGQFKGDADETYYMCVMVSGVEYWFPVYEMFKQAAWQLGVKSVYTGTPEYDVNKQIAVFEYI